MEHYVTLFNSTYLPQGLALNASMERHIKHYTLWIICVDDKAYQVLEQLQLSNVCLLRLSKLETEELIRVKLDRSIAEYCWTLTPFAPRLVFEANLRINRVTYVDADLWFIKNPAVILNEFDASEKQVLITEHSYAPECDQTNLSGMYCVQFMTFTRKGELVRKWWEDRCIEWCYARREDGKFGDQKYLDDWPKNFSEYVHVLGNKEVALAPWNATRLPYGAGIFYHFHGLKIASENKVNIGNYQLPKVVIREIYLPYLVDLKNAINTLNNLNFKIITQTESLNSFQKHYRVLRSFITNFRKMLNFEEMNF